MSCLFCQIANSEVKANITYSDEIVTVFEDIAPQAPHHLVVIPNKHIATLNDLTEDDVNLIGHMFLTAARVAKQKGFAEDGYRTIMNCNASGGQTVFHIHLHLLGGRALTWPPG